MKKKALSILIILCMAAGMAGCSTKDNSQKGETQIHVFVAASLNTVMQELAQAYEKENPKVKIIFNADSSGTLLTQIKEGYECDIFFPAAQKQMDQLERDELIKADTRANVVSNQVVLITRPDSHTRVNGLENLQDASSIALARGSVPVGGYTREALVRLRRLNGKEDITTYTSKEVSEVLGGVEISEQNNVSKVLIAVAEGACEVGTTYYSDLYGYEDKLTVLEKVSYDLTGNVIYPVCLVDNKEADSRQIRVAQDFYRFILSDEVKEVFESYYFDTDGGING